MTRPLPLVRLVVLCACVATRAAAAPDVLFRSGQSAGDGTPLATLEHPRSAGAAGVVVRGTTAGVFTKSGDILSLLVHTGDALPAPLVGTFDTVDAPVVTASGAIVFHATLNADTADEGLFLQEGATRTAVALGTGAGSRLGAFDANGALTIAYVQDDQVFLWDHDTTTATRLAGRGDPAPAGGTLRRVGRVALNATGTVAFVATLQNASDAVFAASLGRGTQFVARRRFGSGALSINAAGQIAFASDGRTSADLLLRYDPEPPSVTIVAKKGDAVGGATLTSIDPEFTAIDDAGRIAFEARVSTKGAPRRLFAIDASGLQQLTSDLARTAAGFSPRFGPGDAIVWTQDRRVARYDGTTKGLLGPADDTPIGLAVDPATPSINDAGVVAFAAAHEALYLVSGGTATPVVRVGDRLVNGSVITAIGAHGAMADAVVFRATLDGVDVALLFARGGNVDRIVTVGDASPVGGKFAGIGDALDVGAGGAVFTASVSGGKASEGVFRANLQSGRIDAVATSRGHAGRPHQFATPVAVGGGAIFRGLVGEKAVLLQATAPPKLRRLLGVGQGVRALGGRVTGLRGVAPTDTGAVVVTTLTHGPSPAAVLAVGQGKPSLLYAEGDTTPDGGAFADVDTALVTAGGTSVATLVPLFGAGAPRGVFRFQAGAATTLLLDGATVAGGGAVVLSGVSELSLDGDRVLFESPLTGGAGAARALLALP